MQGEKSYHMLNDREQDDLPLPDFPICIGCDGAVYGRTAMHADCAKTVLAEREELQRELDACRAALEPFARMFTWSSIAHGGDEAQVLWRKHWLTGKHMKLVADHFRLAAVAYYHKGIIPTERKDQATEDAELSEWMAAEIERAAKEDERGGET